MNRSSSIDLRQEERSYHKVYNKDIEKDNDHCLHYPHQKKNREKQLKRENSNITKLKLQILRYLDCKDKCYLRETVAEEG